MIVSIIGARGGAGFECVKRCIESASVKEVRAIIRNPDPSFIENSGGSQDKVKIIIADFFNSEKNDEKLVEALNGSTHIIFAAAGRNGAEASLVDDAGVGRAAEASKKAGAKRFLLISSQLVDPINGWSVIRMILNSIKWGMMDAKNRGEQKLRASGMEYTIIRPGRLIEGPVGGSGGMTFGQNNASFGNGGASTRADIAKACLTMLVDEKCRNATIECAGLQKKDQSGILFTFDNIKPDSELSNATGNRL